VRTLQIRAEAQIPKLWKVIARMQPVKANFMPELTQDHSGGCPVSNTTRQIKQEYSEHESHDHSRAPREKRMRVTHKIKHHYPDLDEHNEYQQPPPMALMHVAFCKMAVDMLRNDPQTKQQDLIKVWGNIHCALWSARTLLRTRADIEHSSSNFRVRKQSCMAR
jgi:hypothetical protein